MREAPAASSRFRRVLLKMSGEALLGDRQFGHDRKVLTQLGDDVVAALAAGVQLCMVIGGGNIVRGGTLAAAGLPPLNGFVSEWLLLLLLPQTTHRSTGL